MSDSHPLSLIERIWKIYENTNKENPQLIHSTLGFINGIVVTYAALVASGHLAMYHGPERRDWNINFWTPKAVERIKILDNDSGYSLYRPRESTRNFLLVTNSTPSRRVRRVLYFNRKEGKMIGIVKFGADCEGPPRTVHGGLLAAVADAVLGACAFRTAFIPCLTGNLNVNYINKVPLGSTVLVIAQHLQTDDVDRNDPNAKYPILAKKLKFSFKMTSLNEQVTFCTATGLFVNSILPGKNSFVPPILRFGDSNL